MVRKVNCETPPSGGCGHSFHVLPSDLVELRDQVQLLEAVSWQIFYVHNNDLWFNDSRYKRGNFTNVKHYTPGLYT